MSDSLNELYQAIILEHSRHPHNAGVLDPCTHVAEGYNPLCGDEVTVYCLIKEGRIQAITFKGEGCAISKASASLMTERLKGKTIAEAKRELALVFDLLMGDKPIELGMDSLGDLIALQGVRQFPARIKCATLAWHAFESALKGEKNTTTES
jgi:nitrogen fixation NifU-like protein